MPTFSDFDSADDFTAWFDGPAEVAGDLYADLQREASHEYGDPDELLASIAEGAGYIADVGVEILSGVDVPAIDSEIVALKSDNSWGGRRDVLLKDDGDEKRISYAAAMIPRETDKEGDVVATPTVEKAAHDYLQHLQNGDGDGVDTDHNLIDDKGRVVESWVLDEAKEYDLPDGGTRTHDAGTWMVGIKWEPEPWERVKAGEISGISIYGMAEHVELGKSTAKQLEVPFADEVIVDLVYGAERAAEKAAAAMGMDETSHEHDLDGRTVFMPGPDHDTYVEHYNDIADGERELEAATDADTEDTMKDEDPCWDGYTMVGTDEDGAPRCVPDDDVPDADFDRAVSMDGSGPPEDRQTAASDGQTVKDGSGESNKQKDTMSDTDSTDTADDAGGGAPDFDPESFKSDIVDEVKDALDSEAGGDTGTETKDDERTVDELAAELANQIASHDSVDADPGDITESILNAAKEDHDDDDEDDEEEMTDEDYDEKSADESANFERGHTGEGVRKSTVEDGDDAATTNPLQNRSEAVAKWEGN